MKIKKFMKSNFNFDVRNAILNQLIKVLTGPVVLLFLPLYTSSIEQGYWYSFLSLGALAVFADMGFSSVLMIYAAHEFSGLVLDNDSINGDKNKIESLSKLWSFSQRWSFIVLVLVFPLVSLFGIFWLYDGSTLHIWIYEWLIYSFATAIAFFNSIRLYFIEGCNSVGEVSKIRSIGSLINVSCMLLFLMLGFDLLSLSLSFLICNIIILFITRKKYGWLIDLMVENSSKSNLNWGKKIFPLMSKYAVSWISGYFIFQIFSPLVGKYYGIIEAGRVGYSIAVISAMFIISLTWINSATPIININISQKDFGQAKRIFRNRVFFAIMTYVFFGLIFPFIYFYVFNFFGISSRLVSIGSLVNLYFCWFLQLLISSMAVYIRSFKEEPLMIVSMINGLLVTLSTLFVIFNLNIDYIFSGLFLSTLFVFPWIMLVFIRYWNLEYV